MSRDTCVHDFGDAEECKKCGYEMDIYDAVIEYRKNNPEVKTESKFVSVEKTEYSYSLNEEDGYTDDIHDCIAEYYDNETEEDYPFEMKVYRGEKVTFDPSHFLPLMEDRICDEVNDQCGDWSERWQSKIYYKSKKLNEDFKAFFDKWCEENDCKINFHNIDNVVSETWIVRSEDDYEVKK